MYGIYHSKQWGNHSYEVSIEKPVPENLVSNYEAIGWEVVKEKELPKNEPLVKENK